MQISVVIPCFNAAPYLRQTLSAVLAQTRAPSQVILVDDASTDESVRIAESFAESVTILSGKYGGSSAARNQGALSAEGEAVMFLDADDVLGPTTLDALCRALEREPAGIALCKWYRLERFGNKWLRRPASSPPRRQGWDDLSNWLVGWYHPPCSVLWSRAAYEQAGGWDENVRVNTDGDIVMRALVKGVPLIPTTEGDAYYRRVDEGVSSRRFSQEGIESRIFVIEKIGRALEASGKLGRYRIPLGEAFDQIANDCRDQYPHFMATCRELAHRYGEPLYVRAARQAVRNWKRRLRAYRNRFEGVIADRFRRGKEAATLAHSDEVRFGLD